MTSVRKSLAVALVAFCGVLTVVVAAPPTAKDAGSGNSCHLFTRSLHVDNSGVVAVPSRFKWSVETSFSGVDLQGNKLPDSRVMLRLYDPDQNFTALTAQMDLATATRLHHELGEILVKKREDPAFEHRPQLYDPRLGSSPMDELRGSMRTAQPSSSLSTRNPNKPGNQFVTSSTATIGDPWVAQTSSGESGKGWPQRH